MPLLHQVLAMSEGCNVRKSNLRLDILLPAEKVKHSKHPKQKKKKWKLVTNKKYLEFINRYKLFFTQIIKLTACYFPRR